MKKEATKEIAFMKRFIPIVLMVCFMALPLFAQSPPTHYYYNGQPIELQLHTQQIIVHLNRQAPFTDIRNDISARLDRSIDQMRPVHGEHIQLIEFEQSLSSENLKDEIANLKGEQGVRMAAPVYRYGHVRAGVTDRFIVRFQPNVAMDQIERINRSQQVKIDRMIAENTYVLSVNKTTGLNGLMAANRYHDFAETVWSTPDFVFMDWELLNADLNDTYWKQQWAHRNTGQSVATGADETFPQQVKGYEDADMDVDGAWNLLEQNGVSAGGSKQILVAIVDSGIDHEHPDLDDQFYSYGKDFTGEGTTDDVQGHGTACAGIVAAEGNNGFGVAGVAYNVQLLPVKFYSLYGGATNSEMAEAIDYAWQEGSDVLSNSWSGDPPNDALDDALYRAKTQGRDGKGCVIFYSSGNKGHEGVSYPSYNDEVISIGASNMFDEKKNPGSGDYIKKWGGNYGSELDMVAPALVYTTDLVGSDGFEEGDYNATFGGTSAACPNASAVAALVLSADPNLTSDQVQQIMEQTADRIELYPYDENGWNKHVGNGRVNALGAVRAALNMNGDRPVFAHTPLKPTSETIGRTVKAVIRDDDGIDNNSDNYRPRVWYQTIFNSDTSNWQSIYDEDGPSGDTYQFSIPAQSWGTQVRYYIAARDNSSEHRASTFPFGGSGNDPPGNQPPPRLLRYHVGDFETQTYQSSDVPISWSDWHGHTSNLNVPDNHNIVDVDASINVSGQIQDFAITLETPDQLGAGITMLHEGDAYDYTTFDDEADMLITEGSPPYSGRFQPDNGMFVFDGKESAGDWTLRVYDDTYYNNGGTIHDWSVDITYTKPLNPPQVSDIPDQTISQGESFNSIDLDAYVSDADHSDEEMEWSYSGNEELLVSIDTVNRVATIETPSDSWHGSETITFTATDPTLLTDGDQAVFTVLDDNDPPNVSNIPSQEVAEGQTFESISLDEYVDDPDNTDAEMTWTASGNDRLEVEIDDQREATIIIPDEDWNGSETITFRATDPGDLWDEDAATFTVTAVNDTPRITSTADTTSIEDQLYEYRVMAEDADKNDTLRYVLITAPDFLSIETQSGLIKGTPLNEDVGAHDIRVRVSDSSDAYDEQYYQLEVKNTNDSPQVTDIPDQEAAEGQTFESISLDEYGDDPDNSDAEMTWTASGNDHLEVEIDDQRVATIIIPDEDWNGSETITFRATDPGELWDEDAATFTVIAVNDTPRITSTADTTAIEDQLYEYQVTAEDVDENDSLSFALLDSPHFLSINSESGLISGTPQEGDAGEYMVRVKVEDAAGAGDEQQYTLSVDDENNAPVVNDIPDRIIKEGDHFKSIELDVYVSDPDNEVSEMTWTANGNDSLEVEIDDQRVATIVIPNEDWNGSETITFRATDPGDLWDEDAATFTVTAENDTPRVYDIPDQEVVEGTAFQSILLDDYVQDPDHGDADIQWQASGYTELNVHIDSDRRATVTTPDEEWNGSETVTFTATDPEGAGHSDSARFTATAVDDTPVIASGLPALVAAEDDTLWYPVSDFYPYVTDPDDPDSLLDYSLQTDETHITIESQQDMFVINGSRDWYGSDSLLLVVGDKNSADSSKLQLTIYARNDAPAITGLPDSVYYQSGDSTHLNLQNYESDADLPNDSLHWRFTVSDTFIEYRYDTGTKRLTLTSAESPSDFSGAMIVTLTDDSTASDRDTLGIAVAKTVTTLAGPKDMSPSRTELLPNYPNPFNPVTRIRYTLNERAKVIIEVFDTRGRKVTTLLQQRKHAGRFEIIVNARNWPSGLYYIRMRAGDVIQSRKMILLK